MLVRLEGDCLPIPREAHNGSCKFEPGLPAAQVPHKGGPGTESVHRYVQQMPVRRERSRNEPRYLGLRRGKKFVRLEISKVDSAKPAKSSRGNDSLAVGAEDDPICPEPTPGFSARQVPNAALVPVAR